MPVRENVCLLTPNVATVADACCCDAAARNNSNTGTFPNFIDAVPPDPCARAGGFIMRHKELAAVQGRE
jgi:hypothetical protein